MFQNTFSQFSYFIYFTTYLSWPDWMYFYCFFSLTNLNLYDHYVACCVPLNDLYRFLSGN